MRCFKFLSRFVHNDRLEPEIVSQRNPLLPKLLFVRIFVLATEMKLMHEHTHAHTYTLEDAYTNLHMNIYT